jgi:hypothetical protein
MRTQTSFSRATRPAALGISLATLTLILSPAGGMAQNVTLSNGGSSAGFNLGTAGGGTGLIGMNNWTVDADPSISQLNQQWFWYSINGGAVQSIDQINGLTFSYNNGANQSTLTALYQNSQIAVAVSYTLQGNGSGSGGGDLFESVNVFDVSSSSFNINFYQFGNFNLLQNNMNVVNIGGSAGAYSFISQTTSAGGNGIQETINQPYANFAEAGAPGSVMSDVTLGHQLNGPASYGPADAAWALEWSSTVNPFDNGTGSAWNVLQDQSMSIQPVPEPANMAWIAMGTGILGFVRRAWKRKI